MFPRCIYLYNYIRAQLNYSALVRCFVQFRSFSTMTDAVIKESYGNYTITGNAQSNTAELPTGLPRASPKPRGNMINLGSLIREKESRNEKFYSFELFPVSGKRDELYERFFPEQRDCTPLFYSVTWHINGASLNHPALELIKILPNNAMLHLAAKDLKKNDVINILNRALAYEKTNILALLGESAAEIGDFNRAEDLVKFIRDQFGSTFCICVAGYPETHPQSPSKESDLLHLKAKVDAGADFVITQFFFNSKIFIDFVRNCRSVGITVPIIPGIIPVPNYKTLLRMTSTCKVDIPDAILRALAPIRENNEAVAEFGVQLACDLIRDIIASGVSNGFQFFTLNRPRLAYEVCRRSGLSTATSVA